MQRGAWRERTNDCWETAVDEFWFGLVFELCVFACATPNAFHFSCCRRLRCQHDKAMMITQMSSRVVVAAIAVVAVVFMVAGWSGCAAQGLSVEEVADLVDVDVETEGT